MCKYRLVVLTWHPRDNRMGERSPERDGDERVARENRMGGGGRSPERQGDGRVARENRMSERSAYFASTYNFVHKVPRLINVSD
jgi:hypothetical protein